MIPPVGIGGGGGCESPERVCPSPPLPRSLLTFVAISHFQTGTSGWQREGVGVGQQAIDQASDLSDLRINQPIRLRFRSNTNVSGYFVAVSVQMSAIVVVLL